MGIPSFKKGRLAFCIFASALALAACGGGDADVTASAQAEPGIDGARKTALAAPAAPSSLEALSGVVAIDPSGFETNDFEGTRKVTLDDYVRDRAAAVRLGKALFWDTNVGSDGQTACASCHFHAGADNRIKNTINPGLLNVDANLAVQFTKPALSKGWGANYTLALADFPLHQLADVLDRNSAPRSTTNDVVGSQGVFGTLFEQAGKHRFDDCILERDGIFHVGGLNTRRVTARNSPSVIGAVFNVRNFWDGRANNIFNGFSPFGNRDPDAAIWIASAPGGAVLKARIALADASAASQAVGPPLNDFEMSCGGRTFPDIARRVLDNKILQGQTIDKDDSVLGGWKNTTYQELVQAAFQPRLWSGGVGADLGGRPYRQIEANFPLFFGLAIQLYEATLVADQTPLDRWLNNRVPLGAAEARGMALFEGKAQCINCHNGPELTSAATRLRLMPQERVERMLMGDGKAALYDNGFYNIGVRPTSEDLGVGASDPWGNPLSFTRQYRIMLQGGNAHDPFQVDPCKFEVAVGPDCSTLPERDFRDAVDGAFKVPTLRNIALTGPYFHNGSQATLEQVVDFYNRGGDRRGNDSHNTSGFPPNPSNLDADIKPLKLTASEMKDLVAFMKNALTDPRVAWEKAPFDHPSITLPNGHLGDESRIPSSQTGNLRDAQDLRRELRATGKDGRTSKEGPLQPFHTNLK